MKPTRGQIGKADGRMVPNPIAPNRVGETLGISVATSYRWQFWHREHMKNPVYARIFAQLNREAA